MTSPRILFLDHVGVLGGAELYLLDLARHFRETSDVMLFEPGPFQDRLQEAGVPVHVCPAPSGFLNTQKSGGWTSALESVPGLLSLTRSVAQRAGAYDLLYANSQKSLFVAGLAGLWAHKPVIWNLHDMLTASRFSSFNRRAIVAWANKLTDRVIVNSEATRAAFAESGGRAGKTTVVYNGIDPTLFTEPARTDPSLRTELDLPEAPLLGVFSRLAPWKGQHVVLNALGDVEDVHAVFVGDTLFRGDAPYEEKLRQQAGALGVEDRVHFLGFRNNIPHLMNAVDMVVHASTEPEPFGRVIIEGMLAQQPVIATRAGGAREIVDHGETGLLTTPGDSEDLADAVTWVQTHPSEAEAMARRGRKNARRRFSLKAMIDDASDAIQRTLS